MSKNKPNILMTHEACKSKLRSVVRSSIHPYPGNWVAIGRAVVYYASAASEFSAGIKRRHCRCLARFRVFQGGYEEMWIQQYTLLGTINAGYDIKGVRIVEWFYGDVGYMDKGVDIPAYQHERCDIRGCKGLRVF